MKIDIFILGLLRFLDDSAVFPASVLQRFNDSIKDCLGQEHEMRDCWYAYTLETGRLVERLSKSANNAITITSAELGYYHHRVFLTYSVDNVQDFSQLRQIRDELKMISDEILQRCFLNQHAEIQYFYTYPFIIVNKALHKVRGNTYNELLFSSETTSLSFEILEHSWWKPFGNTYQMRISIPSTILYSDKRVNKNLFSNIINAIYQYCLYQKKIQDIKIIPWKTN